MDKQLTLGELIKLLKKQEPSLILKNGFGSPHSYRGYYNELAFEPKINTSIREMLDSAELAVGTTYIGWKGGRYIMTLATPVNIAEYGACSLDESDALTEDKLMEMIFDCVSEECS